MKQGTSEWHQARKNRVTGSMVGSILGLSPFMTREDAMRSMVRDSLGAEREFIGNAATEWGNANERMARGEYELETMNVVQEAPFVSWEDWLGASPDGYVDQDRLVEFKCPYGLRNDPEPVFKSISEQPHYAAQMQIQMLVTGRIWCDFYQWTPRAQRLECVKYDQDWIDRNLPILRQFYAEFLHEVESNPEDHLSPKRAVLDTPTAHMLVQEWDDLTEAIERAEEKKKELLLAMIAACGERDALFGGRKLTKIEKAGSVSYAKALKDIAPKADLEPYRGKPTTYWKLT